VEAICSEHGLTFRRDQFGNVLVHLKTGSQPRPFVLAAHLDHPGFEVVRELSGTRWLLRFRGGVPDEYFRPGLRLRLMPGGVPAKLGRRQGKERCFLATSTRAPLVAPKFAVWELEDFALRSGTIHGRACDDLIGVASILATMIELKRGRASVNVIGIISRAEEVGFHGALAVAAKRAVPLSSLVVSLETSRELPGVKMGKGVILRVGDRTSIFDSEGMRFLGQVAAGLGARRQGFLVQRALMSGGTCEATAYQEFGYQTAAVCIALGNYHNCGPRRNIAAEFVNLADAVGMVELLVAAARQMKNYRVLVTQLPMRLQKMSREAQKALAATALG
jgi:endoglucanase